jgi:hypothetical protein
MNSSVYSADRGTHLRILITALIASIAVVAFAISVRIASIEATQVNVGQSRKAGIPNEEAVLTSPARSDARRI